MEFEERLEEMLDKIEFKKGASKFFSHKRPGYMFYWVNEKEYFNPILEELFEQEFIFSEEKERAILRTIKELILNSAVDGCHERDDLHVTLNAYCGNKGIVFHVQDEGNGFNYRTKLEQRKKELNLYDKQDVLYNVEKSKHGGYGLYCILTFPEDFEYNEKGNEVAVRFNLEK